MFSSIFQSFGQKSLGYLSYMNELITQATSALRHSGLQILSILKKKKTTKYIYTISKKAGYYASHFCPQQLPSCSQCLLVRTQVSAQLSLLLVEASPSSELLHKRRRLVRQDRDRLTADRRSYTGSALASTKYSTSVRRWSLGGLTSTSYNKPTGQGEPSHSPALRPRPSR